MRKNVLVPHEVKSLKNVDQEEKKGKSQKFFLINSEIKKNKLPVESEKSSSHKKLLKIKKVKVNLNDTADKSNLPKPEEKYEEQELFIRGEGYCFGEWGLLYNIPRATSVKCLEDTVFFSLNEEKFKISFMKCLNKAEMDKRDFIIENLFPIKSLPFDIAENLYKNTFPIHCKHDEIIYNEGDDADAIYIVYVNQFILEKQYLTMCKTVSHIFKVLYLTKGGIAGLEGLYGSKTYKCTLKADCKGELAVIYSIKIKNIPSPWLEKLRITLRKYYDTISKTIDNCFEKKIKLDKSRYEKEFQSLGPEEKWQKVINKFFDSEYYSSRNRIESKASELKMPSILFTKKLKLIEKRTENQSLNSTFCNSSNRSIIRSRNQYKSKKHISRSVIKLPNKINNLHNKSIQK